MPATQTKISFPEKRKTYSFDVTKTDAVLSKQITGIQSSGRRKDSVSPVNENCISSPRRGKRTSNASSDGQPSPPKQRLSDGQKKGTPSPSSAFTKLTISPSKKHDDKDGDRQPLSPKCLFGKETCFRRARQALHSSVPDAMPGREAEIKELNEYLTEKLDAESSGTLYISGPPGTGKTACLSNILKDPQFQNEFKKVYVNCTSMKSSRCIYSRICEELRLKLRGKTEKDYVQSLTNHWKSNKKMTLLVLDEIDQLESKNQAVLYTIFEWPSILGSKLVLIGIANALDLTDRILPRLQAYLKLKPRLMHFAPYSKEGLVQILTERLKEMDVLDVFSPFALQLLAGKVAAVSGDVRRALDIGRRVLELAESQKLRSAVLTPTTDHSSNTTSPRKKANTSVDLKIVMNVLNSVYGTSMQLSSTANESAADDAFPLQQKIVVCSLVLLLKKGKSKDISIGKLHEIYRKVCKKRNLVALDIGEFFSICQLIETRGIVQVQMKKDTRMAKIRLMWDEEEVASALQDKTLLATILSDPMLL